MWGIFNIWKLYILSSKASMIRGGTGVRFEVSGRSQSLKTLFKPISNQWKIIQFDYKLMWGEFNIWKLWNRVQGTEYRLVYFKRKTSSSVRPNIKDNPEKIKTKAFNYHLSRL